MASASKIWDIQSEWNEWVNESGGETRVINNSLVLPFKRINHLGINSFEDEDRGVWRFDQIQSFVDQTLFSSDRDMNPNGGSIGENGYFVNVNEYCSAAPSGNAYRYPATASGAYVAVWFKSSISDYSNNRAFIIGYGSLPSIESYYYLIYIDENNFIKARVFYLEGGSIPSSLELSPVGGDIKIDTNWHVARLIIGQQGVPSGNQTRFMFIVDNSGYDTDEITVEDSSQLTGGLTVAIGTNPFANEQGFFGTIGSAYIVRWTGTPGASDFPETYEPDYRFEDNIFLSSVIDTGLEGSILQSIKAIFNTPDGSGVQFSFRASDTSFDQNDSDLEWSGFTYVGQVSSDQISDIEDLGSFIRGRYVQVRVLLSPSTDNLQVSSPELSFLQINTSTPDITVASANSLLSPGTILGQIATFDGTRNIHKVSLDLDITANDHKKNIIGKNGTVSFQAANWQVGRHDWAFQPVLHWNVGHPTSGMTIKNTLQSEEYLEVEDAVSNAPMLQYKLFFPNQGAYDLWGFGYVDGDGIYWSFDGDTSHLRQLTLGLGNSGWFDVPRWTKFGTFYVEEGGFHTFEVYLRSLNSTVLDQWYFTTNTDLASDFVIQGTNAISTPLPVSEGPYNTAVRVRSLNNNTLDSLTNPMSGSGNITAWLPSQDLIASGRFNYEIRERQNSSGVTFTDGVSLEFWQIGGSDNDFAAWAISFPDEDQNIGATFRSSNYGQEYTFDS